MGRVLLFPVITAFLLWAAEAVPAGPALRLESLPAATKQGEACLIRALGPATMKSVEGTFRGERLPMAFVSSRGAYEGLLGIDMNMSPGRYEMNVVATGGDNKVLSALLPLKVGKADFGIQVLSLPPSMVDLDARTLERVNREAKRLEALFRGVRGERLWGGPFLRPVQGELSSTFGLRRIINGQPRSSHTGVDVQAREGTPVLACSHGVVVLVDELFFSGKSVILDHGWALYSMYFHLSEALVKEGDRIERGAILGRVGSTGRSTRPHLHWGVKLNGARVDPLSLLPLSEHLKE